MSDIRAGAPRTVRAVVSVGDVETSYLRVGRGTPVLVLDERGGEAWDAASAELEARWGLIVPDRTTIAALAVPGHGVGTPFARWLDGFLQGLGIEQTLMVAPGYVAGELRAFAAGSPGRLGGVVLRSAPQERPFPDDVPVRYVPAAAPWADVHAALIALAS